ncbi:hypothetical protein QCA50_003732 [Cerrena zonata]|uniref:DUF7770 domain-containing protein n=1 Tax=Cerrena zonata TaxID=2478898 RepID=A0AAW0GF34_9APHY
MDTLYLRRYRQSDHALRVPTSIATTAQSTTSDSNVYHWHIYFCLGEESVLFDIIPGADLRTGVLMILSQDTARTTCADALEYATQPTSSDFTIQNYIDLFIEKRLDKYIYTDTGSGCRWWCTTVLEKLEEAQLIPKGSTTDFLEWVNAKAHELPSKIPMPVRKGQFY